MTKGRELPVNSKVRRRLFQDDPPEPYPEWQNHDQLSKFIKTEYIARTIDNHLILQGMKWNFNFHSETALRGRLQWYRKGNSDKWVMMEPTGRSINMRKRSREPSTCEDERRTSRKKRRLSPHTVALRRGFFTDGRAQNMALTQAGDENYNNEVNGNPFPRLVKSTDGAFIVHGYDRPPWNTEEEIEDDEKPTGYQGYEKKDELKQNQDKHNVSPNETSTNNKNNNGIAGVETLDEVATIVDVGTINGLADHLRQAGPNPPKMHDYFTDIIEVDKDDNDNEKPLISENKFNKLHIDDKDLDEKEQIRETDTEMNKFEVEQDDRDNEEQLDMKNYGKEQNVLVNYDDEQSDMKKHEQNDMKTNEEDQDDMENNKEEQIEMKNYNENTPKNEKKKEIALQKKGKAKVGIDKAKKKLHNSRY